MANQSYAGSVNAPEFPLGAQWFNTSRPILLKELRGRIVLLDFWAYCCINCMHIIPHLRRLEREFPEELVVIGVHSPKFLQERSAEHVRQAIMRYGVSHPVVNDADMAIWQAYTVRAWPTLMFIDPEGKVVGKIEGELTFDQGVELVTDMIQEFSAAGTLKPAPLEFTLEHLPESLLNFPGKVLADGAARRLFISDTGHHRILMTDLEGHILEVIGSGNEGLADGIQEGAQFNRPQGMDVVGEVLYVSDTENHAIRRVDLERRVVETIAGTGRQGVGSQLRGEPLSVDLRSPWDVVAVGGVLQIAMAGTHQLWSLDDSEVAPSAGSGREDILDGRADGAALAQPSGIAYEDGVFYFSDSETSSIRAFDPKGPEGRVWTLVGRGLFDFGDVDGVAEQVRLQHPLGVDVHDGIVYVADTYNNKIKCIDAGTQVATALAGTGVAGFGDGPLSTAQFYEPGGVSFLDGKLYVADTNNHAIRVIDPAAGEVTTLIVDF